MKGPLEPPPLRVVEAAAAVAAAAAFAELQPPVVVAVAVAAGGKWLSELPPHEEGPERVSVLEEAFGDREEPAGCSLGPWTPLPFASPQALLRRRQARIAEGAEVVAAALAVASVDRPPELRPLEAVVPAEVVALVAAVWPHSEVVVLQQQHNAWPGSNEPN